MKRFAILCLFAAACAPRCLEIDVNVTNASSGQVRVLVETPDDYTWEILPETGGWEGRVRDYWSHGTRAVVSLASGEPVHATYCDDQSPSDTDLTRVSAWIEPDGAEPVECDERWHCPPEGAPYAETLVTFAKEGVSHAVVELDATAPPAAPAP